MSKNHRVSGYRHDSNRPALARVMALLAIILAAAMVLSTQAAFARPITSDGGADTNISSATKCVPIPGQTIYTVAFSQQSEAAMQAARDRVTGLVQANDGRVLAEFPAIDAIAVCVPDGVAGQLRVVPGVRYVEADVEYHFSMDEAAEQVDVMPLWDEAIPDSQYDGHGIVVCVIDSGAATWHPDLRGKINKIYNFVGEAQEIDTSGPKYVNGIDNSISGHGTFVASQIIGSGAASTGANGGPGIYKGTLPGYSGKIARDNPEYAELRGPFKGLAPGVTLYPMRVSIGSGASSLAIKSAIQKAIDIDADVISMSMNSGVEDQSMNEMVAKAVAAGIVFVVSAGNSGDDPGTVQCPANLPQVITVGAVTRNDEVADFSSRGPTRSGVMKPDITAVGETVIAASRALGDVNSPATPAYDPENNFQRYYQEYSGTSMSTPEVAAAAAIVMQRYNDLYPNRLELTPEQVKQILIKSARQPYGCPAGGDSNWGNGVLDISAAIKLVEQGLIPAGGEATVPSAYFEKPEYSVSEGSGSIDVKIVASNVPLNGLKLKVEAFSGSGAVPGQDFAAATKVLTFTEDEVQTFPVEIFDNPLPEGQKIFIVKISPENADENIFIPAETCKVTIRDDDQAIVRFAVDSYTVQEQQLAFDLPIKVIADWTGNPAAGDITVRIEAIDGSATAGTDFTPILPDDQIVTIEKVPGTMIVEQTVNVEIRPSAGKEGLEFFTVKLSGPDNAVLGNPGSDTVWVRPSTTDTTAPYIDSCVTPTPSVGGEWYTSSVQVDITVKDDSSGIDYLKYSVNGGLETTVDGGHAQPVISDNGVNILDYRAVDNCGNSLEGTPVTIKIDLAPPVTICTMQSDTTPGMVRVTLAASDGAPGEGTGVAVTYYKKPSDTVFLQYNGEFMIEDGAGAVEFYSVDVAGHEEAVKSRPVQVDIAPPFTTSTLEGTPGTGGWYNDNVVVTLSATDDHQGVPSIEYRLNDGAWQPYSGPFTVTAEGENKVNYRSTDLADNVEVARTTMVKIDRAPPISDISPNPTGWTNQNTFELSAVDYLGLDEGGSGVKNIFYSLDHGTTWTSYTPSNTPCTFTLNEGHTTVMYNATDNAGNDETIWERDIAIDRTAPTITPTLSPSQPKSDGYYYGSVEVLFTASDADSGIRGDATSKHILTADNPSTEWTAWDNAGNSKTVTVGPLPIKNGLLLGNIVATPSFATIGTTIAVCATYVSENPLSSYVWGWDDGMPSTSGTLSGTDTIKGTHQYNKIGVYKANLTVYDTVGNMNYTEYYYVVIYDPASGFVTGGGKINSPAGSYLANPTLTGTATFGFSCKYTKNSPLPTGETEFSFNTLKFQSTRNDWLTITVPRAVYGGTGTINGQGDYGYIVSTIDGQAKNGGGYDKFRITIWDKATGVTVYDNQINDGINVVPASLIEGGSIVIHKV